METIHFRIDEETKRLAMQTAKRHQTDFNKVNEAKSRRVGE